MRSLPFLALGPGQNLVHVPLLGLADRGRRRELSAKRAVAGAQAVKKFTAAPFNTATLKIRGCAGMLVPLVLRYSIS
jgi:hypothetical protein